MTLTIQRGSKAHDELWRAFTDRDAKEIHLDLRPNGVAVQVNGGIWSGTLPLRRIGG